MLDEHPGDLRPELDGLPRDLSGGCPNTPLAGAVIDELGDPVWMLADDGGPKELLVGAEVAGPLIGQPLSDPGHPDGVGPDSPDSELWPWRDPHVLRRLSLELHDLELLEELLHEAQGAVALLGQDEALKRSWSGTRRALTVFSLRYL